MIFSSSETGMRKQMSKLAPQNFKPNTESNVSKKRDRQTDSGFVREDVAKESARHFSAGAIFSKIYNVWHVASVTDMRYSNDVKLPGGTNKNAFWEQPLQTLCRELGEEINLCANPNNCCEEVYRAEKGRGHTQYFYLVMNWTGRIREGAFNDTDAVTMTAQWTPLIEFKKRCYRGHYDGFVAAVTRFANTVDDSSFFDQARAAGIM